MKVSPFALLAALLLVTSPQGHAAAPAESKQQQVDALFATWNHTDTPGAAVEVVQDGKVIYRHAFGMADIEQGRAITPLTTFHVASVSKQFTALSVLLLAQDGKLSLDDDVRRYLPELPDFGQVIRIRHLLNHTSGLRDQLNLLSMAGWRMDDVITSNDVMSLVRRQRALNFAPGSEFEYCNTGYTLLGMIVERVSGKSLAAFSKERIFDPLGMKHTFFHEQYSTLVPGRAQSYQPSPGTGYEGVALSFSTVGPSSLFTTADDLVLWQQNFDDARVGGKPLLAQMQATAKLNDGTDTGYGDGLFAGSYRGLKTVDHDGADAGFRSYLLRFPDQHLSVVIVANGADFHVTQLGERIADIYLAGKLDAQPIPVPDYSGQTEVSTDPAKLDALVGTYALENGSAITFAKEHGHLVGWTAGDGETPFYASGERQFFAKLVNAQFTFDPPGADGVIKGGTWRRNARVKRATRITLAKLPESESKAMEGEYYSDELHVLYTVTVKEGSVVLNYSRGDITLAPFEKGSYVGPWPFGLVRFQCTPAGGCIGLTATEDRARDVQFSKVAVVEAGKR
jgi:CubicO group peptidase (beta-lactamase class C family)